MKVMEKMGYNALVDAMFGNKIFSETHEKQRANAELAKTFGAGNKPMSEKAKQKAKNRKKKRGY